jgi:hypothetical protein
VGLSVPRGRGGEAQLTITNSIPHVRQRIRCSSSFQAGVHESRIVPAQDSPASSFGLLRPQHGCAGRRACI